MVLWCNAWQPGAFIAFPRVANISPWKLWEKRPKGEIFVVRNSLSKKIAKKYIPTTGGLPSRKNKKENQYIYIYIPWIRGSCLLWHCTSTIVLELSLDRYDDELLYAWTHVIAFGQTTSIEAMCQELWLRFACRRSFAHRCRDKYIVSIWSWFRFNTVT